MITVNWLCLNPVLFFSSFTDILHSCVSHVLQPFPNHPQQQVLRILSTLPIHSNKNPKLIKFALKF